MENSKTIIRRSRLIETHHVLTCRIRLKTNSNVISTFAIHCGSNHGDIDDTTVIFVLSHHSYKMSKYGWILPFFILFCFIQVVCSAVLTDLELEIYTIFNPMPSTVVFHRGTDVTINVMSITVRNNGPRNLPASAVQPNYDIVMYIAGLDEQNGTMVDPVPVNTFSLNDDAEKRRNNGIPAHTNQLYQVPAWPTAVVNYPSDKCQTHSHLCVALQHHFNSVYKDNNPDNDFFCLPFINGVFSESVGPTDCPTEVIPITFSIQRPDVPIYRYNAATQIEFSVELHNAGGAVVPGGENNLAFHIFVGSENTLNSTLKLDLTDSLDLHNSNSDDSIDPWGHTTYTNLTVNITLPASNCELYNYICVIFKKATANAAFEDDIANNIICNSFGDVRDGNVNVGLRFCPELQESTNSTQLPIEPPAKQNQNNFWVTFGIITGFIIIICTVVVLTTLLYTCLCKKKKNNKVDDVDKNAATESPGDVYTVADDATEKTQQIPAINVQEM